MRDRDGSVGPSVKRDGMTLFSNDLSILSLTISSFKPSDLRVRVKP